MKKWDERFLNMARLVASYSKDPSSKVGAVIVRPDKTIAAMGFNGFPRGVADEEGRLADRDTRLAMTLHAEVNAILSAREPVQGYSLYVWPFQPCSHCAAAIIQSGISRVVSPDDSPERWLNSFRFAETMFSEAGVQLVKQ